ncbi:MAG: heparinase II/III family protein [Bacteroidales bacterium]|nr:heparinase II/III family protein [Bacteroidales bacterium]
MKKIILSAITLFLLAGAASAADYVERNMLRKQAPDVAALKAMLVPDQKWVPFPAYSDRAGWDKVMGSWKDTFIERGEAALDYKWQVVSADDYLTHNRGQSQGQADAHIGANMMSIIDLFFAELATGQGRYIDQLMNGAFYMCEVTSWVRSHHLNRQKDGRYFPESYDNAIDLVAGDVGAIMAWVYYYFHDEFDKIEPEISRRIYYELDKRIMKPYLNDTHYSWKGDKFVPGQSHLNNWTPWCSVNCLQVFALCEKDMDRVAKAAYMSIESVDKYLNNIEGDGCCDEGPTYWYQGPAKNYEYLEFLNWITGGKINVFNEPMIRRMGEYITTSTIGNGWVVNFSDASAKGADNALIIYNYGKGVNSPLMMHYAAYALKGQPAPVMHDRFIIRMMYSLQIKEELEKETPGLVFEPYTWYPETQICYMREKDGFFVATKGGHNAQSHNHNDIGTVSLYYKMIPFLIDAGVGTYITKTFSSQRYEIWSMQANYHNVPMLNGVAEKEGRQYQSKQSTFDPKTMTFSVDFAGTFPAEAAAKSMVRTVNLKNGKVTVKDSYSLSESKKPADFNWLTWGDVDIKTPGKVKITVQGETVTLNYDANKLEPVIETIVQDDPPLQRVWGDQVYRVTLRERKAATKGTYTFTFTPEAK